ncbi:MAG TPA: sigma-54-dependent Fis family transcriptional regulator, partial [bacterium]|nr:sigma-54-dependent Fis family transcriptional regulator [bacterium]
MDDPTLSGADAPNPSLPIPEAAPAPAAAPPPPAKPDPRDEACRLLVRLDSPEARARELVDEALRSLPFGPEDAALLQELVL